MTATEMEEELKNLDRRLTNVEQILPTLVTKENLKEALKAHPTRDEFELLRQEMKSLFSEAKTHAAVLFERTQEQLEFIAEHVADISQRLPARQ